MVEVKPVVKELVFGSVNTEPRKVQLSATFVVQKPSVDENQAAKFLRPFKNGDYFPW